MLIFLDFSLFSTVLFVLSVLSVLSVFSVLFPGRCLGVEDYTPPNYSGTDGQGMCVVERCLVYCCVVLSSVATRI